MRMSVCALLVLLPLTAAAQTGTPSAPSTGAAKAPAYVTHAIDDPARAADRKDDARRQMAAVMTFTGAKPGDTVMELLPRLPEPDEAVQTALLRTDIRSGG